MKRSAILVPAGALGLAMTLVLAAPPQDEKAKPAPRALEIRGRLVCLAEELRDLYRAEVPPVHEHILALRSEGEGGGAPGFHLILRTPISEGLHADEWYRGKDLVLTGRVFPGTMAFEVTRTRREKDGKLLEVYYWCEVCSIRGVNPGPCACCQGKVELREEPAR